MTKRNNSISKRDELLDWFDDEASLEDREYVLGHLDRIRRRNQAIEDAKVKPTESAKSSNKTGAERKRGQQLRVSRPKQRGIESLAPPSSEDTSVDVE